MFESVPTYPHPYRYTRVALFYFCFRLCSACLFYFANSTVNICESLNLITDCFSLFLLFSVFFFIGRYWDLVQTHKVTQFYTAPTASKFYLFFIFCHWLMTERIQELTPISSDFLLRLPLCCFHFILFLLQLHTIYLVRALIRFDTTPIDGYDLSSLRVLGSVGEPINPEAWKWVRRLIVVPLLCL